VLDRNEVLNPIRLVVVVIIVTVDRMHNLRSTLRRTRRSLAGDLARWLSFFDSPMTFSKDWVTLELVSYLFCGSGAEHEINSSVETEEFLSAAKPGALQSNWSCEPRAAWEMFQALQALPFLA
jgi:hypothetical protein